MKRIIARLTAAAAGLVFAVASAQGLPPDKAVAALVGKTVVNEQNQTVGKVEHIVIDSHGDVAGAILSTGGAVSRHDVAIPISQFRSDSGKLVLPGATKDKLKALPEFQYPKQRR